MAKPPLIIIAKINDEEGDVTREEMFLAWNVKNNMKMRANNDDASYFMMDDKITGFLLQGGALQSETQTNTLSPQFGLKSR